MDIFDMYRSGFKRGYEHGSSGKRRMAAWELILTKPVIWLPGVNIFSYLEGYIMGYRDGITTLRVRIN
ncbi:hypothetical protein DI392_17990 [Vibrio albus]|uniref:Uncharacterized protein n=1 Tax=Vibrio albus TaxID=2200953 RepID=A0A2U3B540_9VIBR|nr:hypothetical protein [Vibrio albus]PWI31923.1 hypothetical protein DI392_17990 [Vibrio albus]